MSEYETTDLGGDPVEFEFVEGGTYERGVIRSTADRQQKVRLLRRWWLLLTGRPMQAAGLKPDDPLDGWLG